MDPAKYKADNELQKLVDEAAAPFEKEMKRVQTNREAAAKPEYMRLLKQLLDLITSIP